MKQSAAIGPTKVATFFWTALVLALGSVLSTRIGDWSYPAVPLVEHTRWFRALNIAYQALAPVGAFALAYWGYQLFKMKRM